MEDELRRRLRDHNGLMAVYHGMGLGAEHNFNFMEGRFQFTRRNIAIGGMGTGKGIHGENTFLSKLPGGNAPARHISILAACCKMTYVLSSSLLKVCTR